MQKFVMVLSVLIVAAFIAGCGGSSSTTAAPTPNYDVPANLAPSKPLMGGAIQGTALVLSSAVSTFAGTAGTAGFTNNSTATLPTTAKFYQPTGITTDETNFYVTDYKNNVIRKIDQNGKITTLAGSISGSYGRTDGDGTAATFNNPSDITTDGTNLYVTDSGNNTIRIIEIANNNKVTTIGSTEGIAGAVDSVVKADVRFNQPTGITTDGDNLYVTDSGNHTIRRIVISSNAVSTLAGAPGAPGSVNGAPATARFNLPARITTDGTNLFVTDFNNRTIRQVDILTGTVSTLAGIAGTSGSANTGPGVTATFNQPNGITTDGTNLYVTDSYNNTIRKIVIASPQTVTTLAGTAGAAGHVDTADDTPSFNTPIGITTDGTSLYVADSGNHTIRKIE